MTSYGMQVLAGPVITSIASKEKGSMGNRMDCAGSQIKNNASTAVQSALVTGAAVGTIKVSGKMPKALGKFAAFFDKGLKKVALSTNSFTEKFVKNAPGRVNGKFVSRGGKMVKEFSPWVKKLLNLSSKTKFGIGVTAIALPILGFIGAKGIYKMGQIDQKYTDKAQLQKQI